MFLRKAKDFYRKYFRSLLLAKFIITVSAEVLYNPLYPELEHGPITKLPN